MAKYYDWEKTLSYDADVTMVIGNRGIGKTFGLRMQCIDDHIKHGYRFVEICRFKNELGGLTEGYFGRLERQPKYRDKYVFKTDTRYGYIAEKPEEDEKPKWRIICYFMAMSNAQLLKKRTYDKVKRLIFDEAVLEKSDRFHHYLPNEFGILANIVDTVSRERKDTKSIKPRVYLLGNACDLVNPYFVAYGVGTNVKHGYSWHGGKTFLLHYVTDSEYAAEKRTGTVAGRMLAGTEAGKIAIDNEFVTLTNDFVAKKPKRASFSYGIVINDKRFGVWLDSTEGLYYVTSNFPNNAQPIYALTASDMRINYVQASRFNNLIRVFSDAYYFGIIRYATPQVKMDFMEVLSMFGIK